MNQSHDKDDQPCLFKLDIQEVLSYFADLDKGHYHATPLRAMFGEDLAIALMKHYFLNERKIKTVALCDDSRKPVEPAEKREKTRGSMLDCWLIAGDTVYQVEIKSYVWKRSIVNNERWENGTFKYSSEGKVLLPMKPLTEYQGREILPLICYWGLSSGRNKLPFFDVPITNTLISTEPKETRTKNRNFDKVWVFSLSAYLSELVNVNEPKLLNEKAGISVELPMYGERLRILKSLGLITSSCGKLPMRGESI